MAKGPMGCAALVAALLLSPDVRASPPVETSADKEIVVTGFREPQQAATEFVDAVSVEHEGQIARFESRICPAIFGLPDDRKAAVERRLRKVAEAAGIEVETADCRPNLVVAVAADPVDFVRTLHKKRPWLFRDLRRAAIERLTGTQAPARAWHLVGRRESDGRRAEHFVDTEGVYLDAHLTPSHQFSRLKKSTRPMLNLAFVVVDLPSIVNLTIPQLADYAAMRALAMTRPNAQLAMDGRSILGLFDDRRAGRAPALSVTAWDLAYLRALYATRSVTTAAQQRATMARIAGETLAGKAEPR